MKEKEREKEPEVKFEKALAELKSIVEKLESGDLELDDSLKLFERGVKLMAVCSRRLDDAQRRVEIVMKDIDGNKTLREFDEKGEGAGWDDLDEKADGEGEGGKEDE